MLSVRGDYVLSSLHVVGGRLRLRGPLCRWRCRRKQTRQAGWRRGRQHQRFDSLQHRKKAFTAPARRGHSGENGCYACYIKKEGARLLGE
jgi:hypothetical protein